MMNKRLSLSGVAMIVVGVSIAACAHVADAEPCPKLSGQIDTVAFYYDNEDPELAAARSQSFYDDIDVIFFEYSYGTTWFDLTAMLGPYTSTTVFLDLRNQAADDGFDFHDTDFIDYRCCGSGAWTLGPVVLEVKDYTICAAQLLAQSLHEVGHALGLGHAGFNSSRTGKPVLLGYGNAYDPMGSGGAETHFCAYHKEALGFLTALTVTQSGSYDVYALETLAPVGEFNALRVAQTGGHLIEYRQPVGFDADLASHINIVDGALLHHGNRLIDMTPETPSDLATGDEALMLGRTATLRKISQMFFSSVYATPLSRTTGASGYLTVQVNFVPWWATNQVPILNDIDMTYVTNPDGSTDFDFTADATDPDGDDMAYFWAFESTDYYPGNHGDGVTVSHTYSDNTPRRVFLTVSDMKGEETLGWVDLFGHTNTAPSVTNITFDTTDPPNFPVAADVSDAEGDPLTYRWEFFSGATSSLPNPSINKGTLENGFTLFVSDGEFETQLYGIYQNVTPIADAGFDFTLLGEGGPPATTTLNGSGSYDPDETSPTLTYDWASSDPMNARIAPPERVKENPQVTFYANGTYTFTLIVTDGELASFPDTVQWTADLWRIGQD